MDDIKRNRLATLAAPPLPPPPPGVGVGPTLPPAPSVRRLNQLLTSEKPTYTRAWFHNQAVYLDGIKFDTCRFDNCTLYAATADIEIRNSILNNCQVLMADPATRIAALALHQFDPAHLAPHLHMLAPTRNADGSITIGPK